MLGVAARAVRSAYRAYKGFKSGLRWSRYKEATQKSGKVVQGELKTGRGGRRFLQRRGTPQSIPKDAEVRDTIQRKAVDRIASGAAIAGSGYLLTRGRLTSKPTSNPIQEEIKKSASKSGKGRHPPSSPPAPRLEQRVAPPLADWAQKESKSGPQYVHEDKKGRSQGAAKSEPPPPRTYGLSKKQYRVVDKEVVDQEQRDLHQRGKGGYDTYLKGSETALSFQKAFAEAVKKREQDGTEVFTWRGRKYKAE